MTERVTVGGRYRSLFVLGRGGMGSVEAALEIDASAAATDAPRSADFERVVALKRLLPDAARDRRRVEMFLREAKLAAMLDHPNVVSAYGYGDDDGELYLAMEYVEGQPLSRVLRALADAGEALTVGLVAYLLAEVCRGLHAAHELADEATGQALNLVHRDVSPQNVMLGYDGRVRLLDFGVAKIETESVTKTGEVKGKSAYMSPEQAMGDPLDRRSDLFGVGALLFECLALRRMWGDGTDMEVIRKLALESPPRLDATGRDGLPADLVALHERLVARSPDERPATAADVAAALDALVDDRDAAVRALRELLDRHFAAQAEEQRARLTASLLDVAPKQASALRESMLPSTPPPRSSRAKEDEASLAPARAPVAPTRGPRARAAALAAALAVVGLVAWRLGASDPSPAGGARPEPSTAATTAGATLTATRAPEPALASPPPAPSSATPPSASSAPPPSAPAAAPRATAPAAPTHAPTPTASAKSSAPATSARPSASAKPLNVDEAPF